ncbi:MAG: peptidoglycan DD-metalloendopeptidase family protein [Actinomycetota bacterium]
MIAAFAVAACLVLPSGAQVVDPFRAPECDRCAGNRGLELAVVPDSPLAAGLSGVVTFAGQVGGRNYVVVRAASDARVRVTYGGLAAISVSRGDRVVRGEHLGRVATDLFLGVRIGERYVDPLTMVMNSAPGRHGSAAPRFRVTLGTVPAGWC